MILLTSTTRKIRILAYRSKIILIKRWARLPLKRRNFLRRTVSIGLTSLIVFTQLSFISFLILSRIETAEAATAGPNYAGTGANVNDGGTTAWTNPTNAVGDTTSTAATVSPPANGNTSQQLQLTNFGFSVPTGASIDGVTVEVEQQAANATRHRWNAVQLIIGGTVSGTNLSDASAIPTTKGFKTFGSSSTLWGLTPTVAQVNASTFGVSLKIDRNAAQATTTSIFRVRITITYSVSAYNQSSYRWFNNQDSSASSSTFAQSVGGTGLDVAYGVALDSSGNIYVAGEGASSNLTTSGLSQVLIKYNSSGVEQWTKSLGNTRMSPGGVAVDTSGNVYVVGISNSFGAGLYDQTLVKYNSSGVEQWTKTWGGTSDENATALVLDGSGNIFVVGSTASTGLTSGNSDQTLVKYNSSGVEQWSKTWGAATGNEFAYAVALDASNNIYVAGGATDTSLSAGGEDQTLVKYNSSGVEQWSKTWGGTSDERARGLALDTSGNIYVAGYSSSTGFTAGVEDQTLVKYNSSGVEQWTKTWGGTSSDFAYAITLDTSGNVYVAGTTSSTGLTSGSSDQTLIKYDSSGVEQWTKTWGDTGSDIAYALTIDGSGNLYVVGQASTPNLAQGLNDLSLLKFDSTGTIASCSSCVDRATSETDRTNTETDRTMTEVDRTITEADQTVTEVDRSPQILVHCGTVGDFMYTLGDTGDDQSLGIAVDSSGNVFTVGTSKSTSLSSDTTNGDIVIAKYNSSGVEQWTKSWGGTGVDFANDIALDSSGNVYITGMSKSTGLTSETTNGDQVLIKFNSSGVEQWSKSWGGTGTDSSSSLTLDSSGNIYVAGYSNSTGLSGDITFGDQTLVKYNSSGVEQWSKSWGGNNFDLAYDVALDSSGNIYVVGYTLSTGFTAGGQDQTLVKYDSSGVEQWSKVWGGTTNDMAYGLALDSSGNIFVVGETSSSGFTAGASDQTLIKYNSSGVEQWSKTWGGTGADIAKGVVLDSSNNIYVTGYTATTSFTLGSDDQTLVKYNSSGVEQWSKTWGAAGSDQANAIALYSTNYIYVVGLTASTGLTAGSNDHTLVRTGFNDTDCNAICNSRTTSETDRTASETDVATSETDRTTSETDRATSETDRTTSETQRNESLLTAIIDVGTPLNSVAQNTATTANNEGTAFRLRILMHISNIAASASANAFKLQYAVKSGTCDTSFTGETFADVSSSTPIAFYNNTNATDGISLLTNANDPTHSTDTIIYQEYNESGNFGITSAISAGQDGLWDIALIDNGAPASTSYCFRIVTSSGSQLDTYTVVPEITTLPVQFNQAGYRWFDNNDNPTFAITAGGNNPDLAYAVKTDSSGNFYVAGIANSTELTAGSYDQILIKYNNLGVEQWSKTWGGTGDDQANALALDSSGNIYVTGYSKSSGLTSETTNGDLTLVKYNSSGAEQWSKTWGGAGTDYGKGVALDSSGNIYVVGYNTTFSAGGNDLVLIKFDSSGVEQWTKTVGGTGEDYTQAIAIDASNNIYIAGATSSTGFTAGNSDQILSKFDSSGVEQWTKTWGGTLVEDVKGMALDSSGNIYIVGNTSSTGFTAGSNDQILSKYNSSGVEQWTKTWGGTNSDVAYAVVLDSSNNIYVSGFSYSAGLSSDTTTGDQTLVKYDTSGIEQWSKSWGGTGSDYSTGLATDNYQNVYVVGTTASTSYTLGSNDMTVLKFNSSGTIGNCSSCVDRTTSETDRSVTEVDRTVTEVDRTTSETDRATSETNRLPQSLTICGTIGNFLNTWGGSGTDTPNTVAKDASGNIYVAGSSASTGLSSDTSLGDQVLVKYNSSGVEQWSKSWGGTAFDSIRDIAIDSSGNIYAAGNSASTGFTAGVADEILVKYNSSGVEQWTKSWGGTGAEIGFSIALDSSGNIYVAGSSASTGFTAGSNDQSLVKFDSSGVEQWTKTWGGTGDDQAYALALDSSGNIYVVGSSASTGLSSDTTNGDQTLVKYNSSGVEQWSKSWGGTGVDVAKDLALDSSGNIYVVGSSASTGLSSDTTNGDQTLVKYNSSGVEQWSKSWGGTGVDVANAIAIDSSDNIYVVGNTASTGIVVAGGEELTFAKYNTSGTEQWTKIIGSTLNENGNNLVLDVANNAYIVGITTSTSMSVGSNDQLLLKMPLDDTECSGICTSISTSETDRTTSETDRATSETDRTNTETDRTNTEVDRTTSEVRRFEALPVSRAFVSGAYNSVAQNTAITLTQADYPLRLYLGLHTISKTATASGVTLKLQYSPKSGTCDTAFSGESYVDVSTTNGIAFYDATNFTGGNRAELLSGGITHNSDNMYPQSFIESSTITNPNAITYGNDYVWDFSITPYEANNGSYCLRIINNDTSLLNTYTNIAEITISASSSRQQMRHGKYFDGETGVRQAFYW